MQSDFELVFHFLKKSKKPFHWRKFANSDELVLSKYLGADPEFGAKLFIHFVFDKKGNFSELDAVYLPEDEVGKKVQDEVDAQLEAEGYPNY